MGLCCCCGGFVCEGECFCLCLQFDYFVGVCYYEGFGGCVFEFIVQFFQLIVVLVQCFDVDLWIGCWFG